MNIQKPRFTGNVKDVALLSDRALIYYHLRRGWNVSDVTGALSLSYDEVKSLPIYGGRDSEGHYVNDKHGGFTFCDFHVPSCQATIVVVFVNSFAGRYDMYGDPEFPEDDLVGVFRHSGGAPITTTYDSRWSASQNWNWTPPSGQYSALGARTSSVPNLATLAVDDIYEESSDANYYAPIVEINEEIKRFLAKKPDRIYTDLTARQFEELVADILRDFGFDVELTRATRDGGKDIYAYIKNQVCTFLMFVECKKWEPSRHVGLEVVQRLYGVQQIEKANKSMIVTTSFFTGPAVKECMRYDNLMDLKDYDDLKTWLESYK